MKNANKQTMQIQKLAMLALLSAMVAVLAYFGGFIKIGGLASISLTLIPVVIGAALYGPSAGADAAFWVGLSVWGTIITVMVKGILAGLCAGFTYKLLERYNRYLSVLVSAIVCPVVNTGIFLLGCFVFFMDTVKAGATAEGMSVGLYLIIFFVGLNFVFELITNIILSPAIVRIIDINKKKR